MENNFHSKTSNQFNTLLENLVEIKIDNLNG